MITQNTSLFEFLQEIVAAGPGEAMDKASIEWIEAYIQNRSIMLDFRGNPTGVVNSEGEPMYKTDFAVKGAPVDVFFLITEAMQANPSLASLIIQASRFYIEHMPECPKCKEYHHPEAEHVDVMSLTTWEFSKKG